MSIEADNATVRYALQEHDEHARMWTARRIGPDPLAVSWTE